MAWAGAARAGRRADLPPHAFVAVAVDDAATRLARVLRERRPDVVVTYEPGGGYGHPDHVHAHTVATRAVELAAVPAAPDLTDLPVHVVPVVLWAAVPDAALRAAYAALSGSPAVTVARADEPALTLPDPDGPLPSVAVREDEIALTVDTGPVLPRVVDALGKHRTQVGSIVTATPVAAAPDAEVTGCYALSNHVLAPLLDREWYRFAPGSPRADVSWPAAVRQVR
jgi:N-acetyl-1-D-myo-inositol-2-amino-2-deoxy-alpha-D-glucopyranoside deacetylase